MDLFIEQVENHPCLWDTMNPAYKDFEFMEKAWAEIAAATNFPDGKAAKMQWKKLRDNFREALKRHKESKGSRAWRYYQNMEFLIPFMQSKNGDLLIHENDKTSDSTDNVSFTDDDIYIINEDGTDSSSSLPRKKRKTASTPVTYVDATKRVEVEELNQNPISTSRNSLLEFFNSMYSTTETLPAHLQLQVKKKVFEIVMEAEETALMLQDQYEKQNKEYDVKDFL